MAEHIQGPQDQEHVPLKDRVQQMMEGQFEGGQIPSLADRIQQELPGFNPEEYSRMRLMPGRLKQILSGVAIRQVGKVSPQAALAVRRTLTEHNFLPPSGVGILDVAGTSFAAGAARGLVDFFEPLPFVGPKLVTPFISPHVDELNAASIEGALGYMQEIAQADPELASIVPSIVNGAQLLGTLGGYVVPFMGWFRAASLAAGVLRLTAMPTLVEMSAMAAYGGLTGEGSIIASVLNRRKQSAQTHGEAARERWAPTLGDRAAAAFWGAGEIGGLSVGFRAMFNASRILRMNRAYFTAAKTGETIDNILALETRLAADGSINVGNIAREEIATAIARDKTFVDLIMSDPKASKMMLEGGQSYEAFVEAVRNLRGGNVSAVYGIDDPLAILGEAQKAYMTKQRLLARSIKEIKGEIWTGRRPVAHDTKVMDDLLRSQPDNPVFMGYGDVKAGSRSGIILSSDAAANPSFEGMQEVILRTTNQSKIIRGTEASFLNPTGAPKAPENALRTWDTVIEELQGKGMELIVVTDGAGRGVNLIPLTDDVIRSSRRIGSQDLERIVAESLSPYSGEGGKVLGETLGRDVLFPKENQLTALKRRFDDLEMAIFEDAQGSRRAMVWGRGAKPPHRLIDQFGKEGFFEGQQVAYRGGLWEYVKAGAKGRVHIRAIDNPATTRFVLESSISPEFKGTTIAQGLEEGFLPVIDQEFQRFMEKNMDRVVESGIYDTGLKQIAESLERPGFTRVDRAGEQAVILHAEEIPGAVDRVIAGEGALNKAVKEGEAILMHPEPIPNEIDLIWERFMESIADKVPSFTPAQSESLKWAALSRLRHRMVQTLPAEEVAIWKQLNQEIGAAIEQLPNDLRTAASLRGFEMIPTEEGFFLKRVGTKLYQHFSAEAKALKWLDELKPLDKELGPGGEFIAFSTEGVAIAEHGAQPIPAGDGVIDWAVASAKDFEALARDPGMPSAWITPLSGVFSRFEAKFKIPIMSEFFDPVVLAQKRYHTAIAPFHDKIGRIWSGISRKQRRATGEFLRSIREEEFIDATLRAELGAKVGLGRREIAAIEEMQETFNELYRLGHDKGIFAGPKKDFMFNYFSHISPRSIQEGAMTMGRNAPPQSLDRFWAKYQDNGMMNVVETDPMAVMQRYVNAFFFETEVKQAWERSRAFAYQRWNNAPEAWKEGVQEAGGFRLTRAAIKNNDYIMPPDVRKAMNEFLTYVQGSPKDADRVVFKVLRGLFEKMGVNVNERVIQEFANTQMAMWYGAALGFRPISIVKNSVQNFFNMYPRVGGKAMAEGRRLANTAEGVREALDSGAFKIGETGIPGGEVYFQQLMEEASVTASNPISRILVAGPMNVGLRVGRPISRLANRALRGFGAMDVDNRIWAYHSQKSFIMPFLNRWAAKVGKKGEDAARRALEEGGLEFWGAAEKAQFFRVLERDGSEAAAKYISVKATDISQYIYGMGAQPLLLQHQVGRMFGTFGTWPLWQIDLMRANFKNATLKGKFKMALRYSIVTGAITSIGAVWGANLWSWIAPLSPFNYAGGPAFDTIDNVRNLITAPMGYKQRAAVRLMNDWGNLTIPGKFAGENFLRSLDEAFNNNNPWAAYAALMLGRPIHGDRNPFTNPDWGMNTDFPSPPPEPLVPDTGTQTIPAPREGTQSRYPRALGRVR